MTSGVLQQAKAMAALSITEWAARAGTSRPTLSAYLSGRTSPRLETVERLLASIGLDVAATPTVSEAVFTSQTGATIPVLTAFPRLSRGKALALVRLPPKANSKGRILFDLTDRDERKAYYEIVLRRSLLDHVRSHADAVLVAELWDELALPPAIRQAWKPALERC